MKKISLLVVLASICLAISPASAQTPDTTKNKVEIKKKTKVGVNGRQVTKIKMESKGTPEAVTGAVESAVTGKATPATPATPATATTSATPAQPASPNVIVVHPEPVTKVVTVPVKAPTTTTKTTTSVNRSVSVKPATRKRTVVKKPVATSSTTTTTVKTN